MELYAAVRRSVYVEGLSERAAARRFGLARETVRKMLRYRRPPGYRRAQPVRRPKLDAFTGIIDQICTAPGFLDSGLTVFASTPPRPARGGRVAPGPGFGSRTSPASTARCTSA